MSIWIELKNKDDIEISEDGKSIDVLYSSDHNGNNYIGIPIEWVKDLLKPPPKTKKTLEKRKDKFKNKLKPFLDKYGKNLLNEFYGYWTEHGEDDRKMRFEKQTSFDISRRLSTWKKRNNDDGGDKKFEAKTEEYNK